MNISENEFNKAFPPLPHCDSPSAANGYGWFGHGFGWQLEPFADPDSANTDDEETTEVPAPEFLTCEPIEPTDSVHSGGRLSKELEADEIAASLLLRAQSQNFYKLRDKNLLNKTLFEDPQFPAEISSLCYSSNYRDFDSLVWLRPKEITENPQLFVEGNSRFDVVQGSLANCWFVSALAKLAMFRHLLVKVVPEDQSFGENYAGIFRFRFWQYGEWIDVVIDDRLPTMNKKLRFTKSKTTNEFWSALLEKAYAKLHGSYEALTIGYNIEGLQDFTGGVSEMFRLNSKSPNLYNILKKAFERSCLAGALIHPNSKKKAEYKNKGLSVGHCYTITSVKHLQTSDVNVKVRLLRIRNPWSHTEWNGDWHDKSERWLTIPEGVRKEIELKNQNEGEFWMSFEDFQAYYNYLEICNLTPDSLSKNEIADPKKKKWELQSFEDKWINGLTAGGKDNDAFNPQYKVELTEQDEYSKDSKCTLLIALMQKHRRGMKSRGYNFLYIGFSVYTIPKGQRIPKRLNRTFFKNNLPVAKSPSYSNFRELNCRFRLSRGTYFIVPSASRKSQEGSFLLRVFSEKKIFMRLYDYDNEFVEMDDMVSHRIFTIEEDQMDKCSQRMFLKLAGENLEINWLELKEIMDATLKAETKNKGFSKNVCRSILSLSDTDSSGKLDDQEFKRLWADLKNFRSAFKIHDEDGSDTLNGFELREALSSSGYHVDTHVLCDLIDRYGNKSNEVNFEDFVLCALKIKAMIELFNSKDVDKSNTAQFSLDEWMMSTLYS